MLASSAPVIYGTKVLQNAGARPTEMGGQLTMAHAA